MALQAASPIGKAKQETQPKRKYHDISLDVKGYLLICLIFYMFFQNVVHRS